MVCSSDSSQLLLVSIGLMGSAGMEFSFQTMVKAWEKAA